MNNIDVVSDEYTKLQEAFISQQQAQKSKLDDLMITMVAPSPETPLIHQITYEIDEFDLHLCLVEMLELLVRVQPDTETDVQRIMSLVDCRTALEWVKQAAAFNEGYFADFAKQHEVALWMPHFIAENTLRPILQVVSEKMADTLTGISPIGACPCCGEPPRLARIGKNGRKFLHCPRCHTKWDDKKIGCAYCGNQDHSTIRVVTIDGSETQQIHGCLQCGNYTKVVKDSRLTNIDPALLDLKTLQLDYIVQIEQPFLLTDAVDLT